jgi:hypothetical protein
MAKKFFRPLARAVFFTPKKENFSQLPTKKITHPLTPE